MFFSFRRFSEVYLFVELFIYKRDTIKVFWLEASLGWRSGTEEETHPAEKPVTLLITDLFFLI